MFVGTVLHLAGVYRSCRCKRLFARDFDIVELNSNTQLAVDNAEKFWLPIGYMAFGCIWLVCAGVIFASNYITIHLEEWKLDMPGFCRSRPRTLTWEPKRG